MNEEELARLEEDEEAQKALERSIAFGAIDEEVDMRINRMKKTRRKENKDGDPSGKDNRVR